MKNKHFKLKLICLSLCICLVLTSCSWGYRGITSPDIEGDNKHIGELKDESSRVENSRELLDEEKIVLINKWHQDFFKRDDFALFSIVLAAVAADPALEKIMVENGLQSTFDETSIANIATWASENIAHTQNLEMFKDSIGRDPWGQCPNGQPTYKKLLPSEMLAMKIYSGKYTGKCTSIAHSLLAMMRLNGLESDQGVILRMNGHSIGLFKSQLALYAIDNYTILKVEQPLMDKLTKYKYIGFYNDQVAYKGPIKLSTETLKSSQSLVGAIMSENEITDSNCSHLDNFSNTSYALQSLNVMDPAIYIDAALLNPLTRELSGQPLTLEEVLTYVNTLEDKHILHGNNAIQMPDQTIVFKSGNTYDKALLAYILLRRSNIESELIFTSEGAYILVKDLLIDINTGKPVNQLKGHVIHNFK